MSAGSRRALGSVGSSAMPTPWPLRPTQDTSRTPPRQPAQAVAAGSETIAAVDPTAGVATAAVNVWDEAPCCSGTLGAALHQALPSSTTQQRTTPSGQSAAPFSPSTTLGQRPSVDHSSGEALTFHPPTLPAHLAAQPRLPSTSAVQQHPHQQQQHWTLRSCINPVAPSTGQQSESNSIVHIEMAPGSPTHSHSHSQAHSAGSAFSGPHASRHTQAHPHAHPSSRPHSLPQSPTNSLTGPASPSQARTGGSGGGAGTDIMGGPSAVVSIAVAAASDGAGGGKPPRPPRPPSQGHTASGAGALAAPAAASVSAAPAGTEGGGVSGGGAAHEGITHGSVDRHSRTRNSDPQQRPSGGGQQRGEPHSHSHGHHRHSRNAARHADPLRAFLPAHMRQHVEDVEGGVLGASGHGHEHPELNGHVHPDSAGEDGQGGGAGSKSRRYSRRSAPRETSWQKWVRSGAWRSGAWVCARARARGCVRMRVRVGMGVGVGMGMGVGVGVWAWACVHVGMCACGHVCVRACVREGVWVFGQGQGL